MRDQLTAKAPQTPFSKPQILSSFGVFGALAVPYLDTHAPGSFALVLRLRTVLYKVA
jgi:hypothetical protein